MRFSSHRRGLISLASVFLLSNVVLAIPFAAKDGQPEDKPLPGRTDTSVGKDGVITAWYGDDHLPQHMQHVIDSQAKYPGNAGDFPYNPDAANNRKDRLKGISSAGVDPVTGEPRVKDEKTLASQKNLNQKTDTTVRFLPHYESGGKRTMLEQEAYEKRKKEFEKDPNNKGKKYEEHKPKAADGSLKTEAALTSRLQANVKSYEDKHGKGSAKTNLKPNPGWLPIDPSQHRAHEAPAVMTKQKYDNSKKPTPDPHHPINFQPERPKPKANVPAKDPNHYLLPIQGIPQYKGGSRDKKSPTPGISPPTHSEDRIPPRPQSRTSGEQAPNPPKKPADGKVKPGAQEEPNRVVGPEMRLPNGETKVRPRPAGWDKPLPVLKPLETKESHAGSSGKVTPPAHSPAASAPGSQPGHTTPSTSAPRPAQQQAQPPAAPGGPRASVRVTGKPPGFYTKMMNKNNRRRALFLVRRMMMLSGDL